VRSFVTLPLPATDSAFLSTLLFSCSLFTGIGRQAFVRHHALANLDFIAELTGGVFDWVLSGAVPRWPNGRTHAHRQVG
jgi:hypothetical protein